MKFFKTTTRPLRPPIPRFARNRPLLFNQKILKEVLSIFIVSRLLIIFIGYLSNLVIIKGRFFSSFPASGSLLNLFFKWDSQWYMSIVENGYFYTPGEESSVSFFPFYPMLVKFFSSIFGNPELIGFIISNLALLFAAIYLYKLIMFDFKDSRIASKTVFYMLIFPLSFFFSIFYAEGLFLFLAISSFYYARKKQWLIASILGFFLSLTRIVGVLIFIPFLIEYFDINFKTFKINFRKIKKDIIYLLLVPAGLFSYMFYLYIKFNDAFCFSSALFVKGKKLTSIFTTLGNSINYYSVFYNIIFIGSVIFALVLIFYLIYLKIRVSYIIYSLLLLFVYLSSGHLEGTPRFIGILFPLFLGASLLANKNKFLDYSFTLFSVMLLTLFTILFVNGYWFT